MMNNDYSRNTELFTDKLNSKSIFFLTGAGISLQSNMPAVSSILNATAEVFLPTYFLKNVISSPDNLLKTRITELIRPPQPEDSSLQPEMFYGTLLSFFGDRKSHLQLWSCLLESKQKSLGIELFPNVAHYFLVYYSVFAKVPLLTMNYDTLFEKAFIELKQIGLVEGALEVYTPEDTPPSLEKINSGLVLCKLHGTIEDGSKNFNHLSIKTTMAEITKITADWSEFIRKLCTSFSPCFAGYSGRDIDYFPIFKNIYSVVTNVNTELFWLDNFKDGSSSLLRKADETNAFQVNDYFSDVLEKIYSKLNDPNISICFTLSNSKERGSKEEVLANLLNPILAEMKKEIKVPKLVETVFVLTLLVNHSENTDAVFKCISKLLRELDEENIGSEENYKMYLTLLTLYTRLNRERGDFIEYRNAAEQLKKITNKKEEFYLYIYAETEIVSSYQMEVPNFEGYHPTLSDYKLFFLTLLRMLCLLFKYRGIEYNTTLEEFKIRTLASILKIPLSKYIVMDSFIRIRNRAQEEGNYATLISCNKYLSRISDKHKGLITEVIDAAKTIGDSSAEQIVLRDSGDDEEALKKAIVSGNNLNTLKTIIQKARANNNYLSRQEFELFESCENKINSIPLRRALSRIKSEVIIK